MTRISTPLLFTNSLNGLLDQQAKLSEIQLQISSGKRVLTPADDPVAAARLLTLKQQEIQTKQFQSNTGTADTHLSTEEEELKRMLLLIGRVKEKTIQAGNGINTEADRRTISVELQAILKEMVAVSNANIGGNYIFSGGKILTKPVTQDPNGNYIYNGDEIQRDVEVGPGVSVEINDTAKNTFFVIGTDDIDLNTFSGQTSVTSAATALSNSGTLTFLASGNLILNDILVGAAVSDGVSTTDATASGLATANIINATTDLHGVVATANTNNLDFTVGTYTTNALAAGDFTINGVQVVGAPAAATAAELAILINGLNGGTGISGVVASDNAGELRLTAADGRNIQIQTDGTTASGINFSNFDLNGGAALDRVKRGTVTLNDHAGITLGGSAPGNVGFTANTYSVTANAGTGVLSNVFFTEAHPDVFINNEKYLIRFDNPAATFNIYKESDPFTPLTGFRQFSAGQTVKDALTVTTLPVTYTAGDTFIVDGIQFSLSGAPAANDVFTIELEPVETRDLFTATQNLIEAIQTLGGNSPRLSYHLGLALTNLNNAEEHVSEIRSKVGTRMQLSENQRKSNDEFLFFAAQGISIIEDLDMFSAISKLAQNQLSLEAAQRSLVQIQRLSLFDFI